MNDFDLRWEKAGLPADITAAMQELYTLYGTSIYEFFAELYDPEIGGFYLSRSGREHEGFLPDIESTVQILQFIVMSGLLPSESLLRSRLPAEIVSGITRFAIGLEAEEDGYFYHPQWGKAIGDARRGRDLNWATIVSGMLSIRYPYPTANERLSGASDSKVENARPYLTGEAALTEYLAELMKNRRVSYGWANTLNAIAPQIVSAGLGDCAVRFLNSLQIPETGLWSPEVNYHTVSAVMKAGPLYAMTGHSFPYPDKTVRSCIEAAKSDAYPTMVVFIYNPWCGISSVRAALNGEVGYTAADLDRDLYASAADMLRASGPKLRIFQKADGTFSFSPEAAMTTSQGVPVGLGLNEGDVNSTKIALGSTLNSIYGALGKPIVPVYAPSDFDRFCSLLLAARSPKKKPIPQGDDASAKQ